ncbi:MAG TPA: replication-relaxation family protein, partial [Solirubrobacteraceae bacterium]|nr:replication-relaxation family protein [Solirubrobacteraceae bacterium]
ETGHVRPGRASPASSAGSNAAATPRGKGAPHGASASTPRGPSAPTGSASGRRGWRDLDQRLLGVLGRITERDRYLCRLLDEHRVLTTSQVADVAFTGERRARMRLAELYALDVLDRFRPQAWGKPSPFHWTLGPLGAALVAADAGFELDVPAWRRSLVHDLAASQRLSHLVGANGFFTALLRSARRRPGSGLEEWWSERRCGREWGAVVRPDGYGVWREGEVRLPFLLEYDNGTETLARLAAKLNGYLDLAKAAGHPNWVLFSFGSPRREHEASRALAGRGVPVATTNRSTGSPPDDAVWAPLVAHVEHRLRLSALAALPFGAA